MNVCQVDTPDKSWWEECNQDTDDAQKCAEEILAKFNRTLRQHEVARQLIAVEVLPDDEIQSDELPMELSITISGRTISDLEYAIDEVKRLVSQGYMSGFDSNDDGEYSFQLTGEEEEEA